MPHRNIYLHRIATQVPETFYTQDYALELMTQLIGDTEDKRAFLSKIYRSSGIGKRHTVIDDYGKNPEDYRFYPKNISLKPEPGITSRNDLFIREANRLSLAAVNKLFDILPNVGREKITHLITVSCTGFSAPGFDLHLAKNILSSRVNRTHIGFMGCYAAFPALKLARSICMAEPDARVLVVNAELCTLHFQQSHDLDILVANMLFADGVSAALVSAHEEDSDGNRITLHRLSSRIIPGTEENMAWKIGELAFDMKLSAYVPQILEDNISSVMNEFYSETGISREEINLWAIHPGGRQILDRLRMALSITPEDLSNSYSVLNEFGNMSSSTIMFVLEKFIAKADSGKMFSAAFGPGLTVETGYFEMV